MAELTEAERAATIKERSVLSKTLVSYTLFAIFLLIIFGAGLVAMAFYVAAGAPANDPRFDRALQLFDKITSAFFPLVGAWVGAVVAFYFARENFEAATRSAQTLLGTSDPVDILATKPVTSAWTEIAKVDKEQGTADELKAKTLQSLIEAMAQKGRQRLPLLTQDGKGWAIVHDATLRKFLDSLPAEQRADATLGTMLAHTEYGPWLPLSAGYISPNATLAEAQRRMVEQAGKNKLGCNDLFVTQDGTPATAVLGILTNFDLQKAAASARS